MCRCSGGIHKCRIALHFFDHLFVFFLGFYRGYAEGNDLDSAKTAPFFRKNFVKSVRHFRGVARKCGISDSHCGNLCKCRLERCQKFALELAVKLASLILICYVSAYVGVEKNRVADMIAVFAEAADIDINIDSCSFINNAERNGAGSSVFVSDKLFGIEIIDSLIFAGISAEGKTFSDGGKALFDAFAEIARKDGRLGGHIISVFAGFRADIYYFALLDDDHCLTVGDGDYGTVGNDVFGTFGVGTAVSGTFLSFCYKNICGNGFTIKELLPLIGKNAADRT